MHPFARSSLFGSLPGRLRAAACALGLASLAPGLMACGLPHYDYRTEPDPRSVQYERAREKQILSIDSIQLK